MGCCTVHRYILYVYVHMSIDRFLTEWIILPNSTFWYIWERVLLLSILIIANWYVFEMTYTGFYSKDTYGASRFGYFKFFFTYCIEVVFVVDIFVSMIKSDYVHMHCGELYDGGTVHSTCWYHINTHVFVCRPYYNERRNKKELCLECHVLFGCVSSFTN